MKIITLCQCSRRLEFTPRSSHIKDSKKKEKKKEKKKVLDAALLGTQHYKVTIKGKVKQS